jgi:hypothetical protein
VIQRPAKNHRSHYNPLQKSSLRYSAIQCDTVRYSAIQCDTVRYSAIQCDTVRYRNVGHYLTFMTTTGVIGGVAFFFLYSIFWSGKKTQTPRPPPVFISLTFLSKEEEVYINNSIHRSILNLHHYRIITNIITFSSPSLQTTLIKPLRNDTATTTTLESS